MRVSRVDEGGAASGQKTSLYAFLLTLSHKRLYQKIQSHFLKASPLLPSMSFSLPNSCRVILEHAIKAFFFFESPTQSKPLLIATLIFSRHNPCSLLHKDAEEDSLVRLRHSLSLPPGRSQHSVQRRVAREFRRVVPGQPACANAGRW